MAVYKRNYRPYDGPMTSEQWRFLILPRYAFAQVFESRIFTSFFVMSFMPTVVSGVLIYLHHNISALTALDLSAARDLLPINATFFQTVLWIQTTATFFITAFVGPGLVSPDLTNNALPLYLSRPFTRTEYVLGKLTVLVALSSLVTWIPGLLLVLLHSGLVGPSWLWQNMRIPAAIFAASWVWILTISLLSLAISAFVKWKPIAGFLHFGIFFVAAGFGQATNEFLETSWGTLLQLPLLMDYISDWAFHGELPPNIPIAAAWISMAGVCAVSLLLLGRKIRACEVVR
jgi:ABC-2 type transport system permease protein